MNYKATGKSPWRREWLPTPEIWPGELHGLYSPWGHKQLDMTEQLSLSTLWDSVMALTTTTKKASRKLAFVSVENKQKSYLDSQQDNST